MLPDEQKAATVGFLARAVGWFSEQSITCRHVLSYNGDVTPFIGPGLMRVGGRGHAAAPC